MLSPGGNTVESFWKALCTGEIPIVNIEHFNSTSLSTRVSGVVKGFNCDPYMLKNAARKMYLFIQYGIAAGIQALEDSGLEVNEENAARIGVAIGSGIGGLELIETGHQALIEKGPRKVSPFFVPSTIVNMIAGNLSI
ncbi:beta-ketoacyl synthase N-terminal-like domain-containing protein, partial [Comamonas kerstersii]|uniref:beta-ketoacyl synthase N-terminal-like domain-containing protein n=1 Tax=Comamonas kerstersii TaxID=225992 RepID=UPI00345CEEEA